MTALRANARKVVCIGRNYVDHIKELNNAKPEAPLFFLKPSSSILPPACGPILRPSGVDLHYEVELALVMGKSLRDLNAQDERCAMDAVDGYAIGIDMTARNVQEVAKRKGLPWTVAKGFDTFLPLSNYISKAKLPDPYSAHLYLNVNGRPRQSGSTSKMIWRIPHILSAISEVMTLEKGDLVLTGTPKGVGSVAPGDVITAGVLVDGKELDEGKIEVTVEDRDGGYAFKEG